MTPLEMATECAIAIRDGGIGYYEPIGVILTIPKGRMPKGFPRGELLNECERNGKIERTYRFDPSKVLAWLISKGLIELKRVGELELALAEPAQKGGA
jgi:hypothetical protein